MKDIVIIPDHMYQTIITETTGILKVQKHILFLWKRTYFFCQYRFLSETPISPYMSYLLSSICTFSYTITHLSILPILMVLIYVIIIACKW